MHAEFEKLNRLRVNAGKNPLKAWKATPAALNAQIKKFEDDGFTDALPGGNVKATPQTTDPEIIAALTPKEEKTDEPKSLEDSAMGKMATPKADKAEDKKPATKGRASLARGLDTDTMAQQSRMAVQMARSKEKKEKDAAKLDAKGKEKVGKVIISKADKAQIAEEAKRPLPKGQVDPKKEPEKAKRQADKIKEKQDKRKAEGKEPKPKKVDDGKTFTAADLARDLDIDPKIARAKLRRYEGKDEYPAPIKGERWTYPNAAKPALTKILQSKK